MKSFAFGSLGVIISAILAKYLWAVLWNVVTFGLIGLAMYAAYRLLKHYKVFETKS